MSSSLDIIFIIKSNKKEAIYLNLPKTYGGILLIIAIILTILVFLKEDISYTPHQTHFTNFTTDSDAININTATSDELQQLDGIGPAYAGRIIAFRTLNRPFETVYDIKLVSGIGEKTFDRLKTKITVK